jgi:uncharacterized small protein (DUF1192 family)
LSRPAGHYPEDARNSAKEKYSVTDFSSLSNPEIADRIAILRDNIRQLTEQAAAQSGAANEERTAERIAVQIEELENLLKEQERRALR